MYFREGLDRVASVIDGNDNYIDIVQHRLPTEYIEKIDQVSEREAKIQNVKDVFQKSLMRHRPSPYMLPKSHPATKYALTHARTQNNLQELEFFQSILAPQELNLKVAKISNLTRTVLDIDENSYESCLRGMLHILCTYYENRTNISSALVLQHILYSKSYIDFYATFAGQVDRYPCMLIVANDHAPVHVALSMNAKWAKVPRMYLQHAEVSSVFPPLDFEYAVLRNKNSEKIYHDIGGVRSRIFVIPRDRSAVEPSQLEAPVGSRPPIVIYPTARVNGDALTDAIDRLLKNPDAGRINIKQHPNGYPEIKKIIQHDDVIVTNHIPDKPHVAIVGNSSVAIELLRRGIPVYQCFSLDNVAPDYYGFRKAGLTKSVHIDELSEKFWKPYKIDSNWLSSFEAYDPALNEEWRADLRELRQCIRNEVQRVSAECNQSRIRDRVYFHALRYGFLTGRWFYRQVIKGIRLVSPEKLPFVQAYIRSNMRLKSKHISSTVRGPARKTAKVCFDPLLKEAVVTAGNPSDFLAAERDSGRLSLNHGLRLLNGLINDREPCVVKIMADCESFSPNDPLRWWLELKRTDWSGLPISDYRLAEIFYKVGGIHNNGEEGLKNVAVLLLNVLIRLKDGVRVLQFLQCSPRNELISLGTNQRVAVYKFLNSVDESGTEIRRIIQDLYASLTQFERMKIIEMRMDSNLQENIGHRELEDTFLELCPAEIKHQFENFVKGPYNIMRNQMKFMEIRTSENQKYEMLYAIKAYVIEKRPFSLVRLSDGEGYLFQTEGVGFSENDARNRERHWWGAELDDNLREEIRGGVKNAIRDCDILGIPSIFRFIRDHGEGSVTLTGNTVQRGVVGVLNGVPAMLSHRTVLTEDKCNLVLFRDLAAMEELIDEAGRVIIISSARLDKLQEKLSKFGKCIITITIPTHFKTWSNDKYVSGERRLPYIYEDILGEIDHTVQSGDLVLVAGGIIGKLFVNRAKQRGGIALDVGSALDEWVEAGIHSLH